MNRTMRRGEARFSGFHLALVFALAFSQLAGSVAALRQPQAPAAADDLERLRAMLHHSGPDGREDREAAITRLLALPQPEAHRVLHEQLLRNDDPDDLRAAILDGLQRQLLGSPSAQFGGAVDAQRQQIVTGYLGACAPFWRTADSGAGGSAAGNGAADAPSALRASARTALQRVPARELDGAARVLLGATASADRIDVLLCLADMQQTMFAKTIAEQIDAADENVREAAQQALQLLVYPDEPILSKADFDAWSARFGSWRYVDLAERAARLGPRPHERFSEKMLQLRIDAARELVAALVVRTPTIDWAAVQARTIVEERAVLDACLEALQTTLPEVLPREDNPLARQTFCKALLTRFQQVPKDARPELQRRRVLLLGVAAALARPEETELANEVVTLLRAQLDADTVAAQVGALRALRRFPSLETRSLLVRRALALLGSEPPAKAQLQAILDTLAWRTQPRWTAPAPDSADKAEWLKLVDACCRSAPELELRDRALALAQTLDPQEARVPEVFGMLRGLVRDPALDTKYRSTCLIYLQAWRSEQTLAERWVQELQELLQDASPELRAQAADSLSRLADSTDSHRGEWIASTVTALRDRLYDEPDVGVLRALIECMKVCGHEARMPERAIGALRYVLERIGTPVPPEHQFRIDPLLQALAAIASDPHADRGQWIAACGPLLANGKRQSLRLILETQNAVDLARDVANLDAGTAERARRAMRLLIETAALKPPRQPWSATEPLQREARDVRTAFGALESLDPSQRPLDLSVHRLLRLEVDLACGKFQEVVQRATGWLTTGNGNGNGGGESGLGGVPFFDRVRQLTAEAQLAMSHPDAALKLLDECSADAATDPGVLELVCRIAAAIAATNPQRAAELYDRAVRTTPADDPAYRRRVLDWLQQRAKADPENRAAVARDAARFAPSFEAADCPPEVRALFDQIRAAR